MKTKQGIILGCVAALFIGLGFSNSITGASFTTDSSGSNFLVNPLSGHGGTTIDFGEKASSPEISIQRIIRDFVTLTGWDGALQQTTDSNFDTAHGSANFSDESTVTSDMVQAMHLAGNETAENLGNVIFEPSMMYPFMYSEEYFVKNATFDTYYPPTVIHASHSFEQASNSTSEDPSENSQQSVVFESGRIIVTHSETELFSLLTGSTILFSGGIFVFFARLLFFSSFLPFLILRFRCGCSPPVLTVV